MSTTQHRRRRRRWSHSTTLRPSSNPATRIRQLHQDLLLLVVDGGDDDDNVLATRFQPAEASSQLRASFERLVGRLSVGGGGEEAVYPKRDDPPRSPRRQRMRAAADSFRNILEVASSDDAGEAEGGGGGSSSSSQQPTLQVDWLEVEAALIETIRDVAELLVKMQPKERSASSSSSSLLRSDPVFEYFCEAAILPLLVDVAADKPSDEEQEGGCPPPAGFRRVVWSPAVKAQVVQSVTYLVSSLHDETALYFVLSQHSVNRLVESFLPLHQWTDPATAIILPAYVDLLKTLTLQLTASPHLLPCFLGGANGSSTEVSLPLLTALLEAATFGYSRSDSFVHATCLNLLVSLLNIPVVHEYVSRQESSTRSSAPATAASDDDKKVDDSVVPATSPRGRAGDRPPSEPPQAQLASHLTLLFLDRYERLVTLTNGPVVNTVRSTALAGQLAIWNHQIDLLNDVFDCNVSAWNVRICEEFLRGFVSVLLFALEGMSCHDKDRSLHPRLLGTGADVGVLDEDSIPVPEARAQVATLALTLLMDRLEYVPLVRMVAVATLHPRTTNVWSGIAASSDEPVGNNDYKVTRSLSAIVQASESGLPENSFRLVLLNALRGSYGEYRFIPTAMLFEAVINALDRKSFGTLSLTQPLGDSLSAFLERQHRLKSVVSAISTKAAAVLAVQMLCQSLDLGNEQSSSRCTNLSQSPVHAGLLCARDYFYEKSIESHQVLGVSEMFVDLAEDAVLALYKRTTLPVSRSSGPSVYAFLLSRHLCTSLSNQETLIRKMRGVTPNDVEVTRFHVEMAIFYRACCRLVERFSSQVFANRSSATESAPSQALILDQMELAGELTGIFSALQEKPTTGTAVDLRGRMVFPFSLSTGRSSPAPTDSTVRRASRLLLVLDPTELFLLEPVPRTNGTRGTVICCVPLLSVIAAASDHEWLHVAVKHPDVGLLIKNGNMALRFEAAGTCLIVRQYLERCRQLLRAEMLGKIKQLFRARSDGDAEDATDVNAKVEPLKSSTVESLPAGSPDRVAPAGATHVSDSRHASV